MDLRLPSAFSTNYAGPKFGCEGTRKLMGIYERPLIGTIIKPSVGLSAKETGMLVSQLCAGGIDFTEDDELQANGPSCPLKTASQKSCGLSTTPPIKWGIRSWWL